MKIKPIREKDELVRIIKALAKDLEARAEAIADDYNTKVRKIDIHTSIEIDCNYRYISYTTTMYSSLS